MDKKNEYLSPEMETVIRNKIRISCKGKVLEDSITDFLFLCSIKKLNPLENQIYALPFWNKATNSYNLVPQVSIEGLRVIAHRTGECRGIQTKVIYNEQGRLLGAKAVVYRLNGKYTANCKLAEYQPPKAYYKDGNEIPSLWYSKTETMIQKVPEAQALRRAFPNELSGLYITGEYDQTTGQEVSTPKTVTDTPKEDWKLVKQMTKELTTKAESKGINLRNGFAPELIERFIKNYELKKNYDQTMNDLKELMDLVDAHDVSDKPKEGITFDDVTTLADKVMEPDMFLDKYKTELEQFNTAKKDNDKAQSDSALYAIVDDLKAYEGEVTK